MTTGMTTTGTMTTTRKTRTMTMEIDCRDCFVAGYRNQPRPENIRAFLWTTPGAKANPHPEGRLWGWFHRGPVHRFLKITIVTEAHGGAQTDATGARKNSSGRGRSTNGP